MIRCLYALLGLFSLVAWALEPAHIPVSLDSTPSVYSFGCVNVCTRDYCESRIDLKTRSASPIQVYRTHVSSDVAVNGCRGVWCIDHAFIQTEEARVYFRDTTGMVLCFQNQGGGNYALLETDKLCNTGEGYLSGKTNPKNCRLSYDSSINQFVVEKGGGEKLYFRNSSSEGVTWPVCRSVRPDGQTTHYSGSLESGGTITTTDRTGQHLFSRVQGRRVETGNCLSTEIKSTDGQELWYHRHPLFGFFLDNIHLPQNIREIYKYDGPSSRPPLSVIGRYRPEGRAVEITYYKPGRNFFGNQAIFCKEEDPRIGKVLAYRGSGSGGIQNLASYAYDAGSTTVQDTCGGCTHYNYNGLGQLLAVYRRGVSWHHMEWDQGNLIRTSIKGENGQLHFARTLTYDQHGNVIQETLHDPSLGDYHKFYTYGALHNLLEERDEETAVQYSYLYDLIADKKIWHKGVLCEEWEVQYFCHIPERTWSKMGEEERIVEQTLFRSGPRVGMVEAITESCIEAGVQRLLKREYWHYNHYNQVIKKELYDANNALHYTLDFNYDIIDNLLFETDPLGSISRHTYDLNGNRITTTTPIKQVRTTYDYGNHPVREEQRDFAGASISTYTHYDALGRVVVQVDANGAQTRFERDRFGRVLREIGPEIRTGDGTWEQPVI